MKSKSINRLVSVLMLLGLHGGLSVAVAQGTAFTYQGQLTDGGQPANGLYDFRFAIYVASSGGDPVAGPITYSPVGVINGLFTITLDFGGGVFTGEARWLEIAVRTNGATTDFTLLAPRKLLLPAPYALFAPAAGTAGGASNLLGVVGPHQLAGSYTNAVALTHPANALAGSFSGEGGGLSNVNAAALGGLPPTGFWQTGGNAGTIPGTHFLGTTDERSLELRVNNATAFRLLPGHNVIGGAADNVVSLGMLYATIGGGQGNWIGSNALTATIAGGHGNHIGPGAQSATVGGGSNNCIGTNALGATVAGGGSQTIEAPASYASISGGQDNEIHAWSVGASIGGGSANMVQSNAWFARIGGGANNTIQTNAWCATIPGGSLNEVAGRYGFAAGHRARALHDSTFVWADATESDFLSTKSNQFLIRAGGGVGINTNAPQSALHVAGTVAADDFRGRGADLQGVDADRLDGRDSTDFAPATHGHNAGDITAGTLAEARLSANIPRLNAAQTFTAANQFTHAGNVFTGTFQGQGSALTNLDAGNLTSGTLADARLSANIPRFNVPANFTAPVSAPVVQATNLLTDPSSLNNGTLAPGLLLGGASSGEGLASKRTAGGNQYGLDLFTAFSSRLAIANNGAIHIGAGNSFASYGDARSSIYVLRGTGSGASYAELFLPGSQRLSILLNSTWTFRAFVTGRASNGKAAGYCFRGFLENENGAVRVLETINTEDYAEDDTGWDANIAVNDTYDALVVTAKGSAGDTVRWTAVIYTVEVKW